MDNSHNGLNLDSSNMKNSFSTAEKNRHLDISKIVKFGA